MNVQPRNTAPPSLSTAFVEAFDGLIAGVVRIEFARRALIAALAHDTECGPAIQALLDAAYEDTRLSDEDYDALNSELSHVVSEDAPTDWSEAAAGRTSKVGESANLNSASVPGDTAPADADSRSGQLPRGGARLFPGAVLRNRFVLQARMAAGSMGEIYKALDRRKQEAGAMDPFVAIKVISPGFSSFPGAVEALQQEALCGQQLAHPNIVRTFDYDRDGEHAYITMEWLEGESLAELLTRLRYRPMTTARARQIIEDVGSALCHAHGQGIVHGDVKPGNIYLTPAGAAKLLDFGVARATDAARPPATEGIAPRTPAYASCEVLEREIPTHQDDLFSLGCLAYRMLAGRRAFARLSALEAERLSRRAPPITHISKTQWLALERALAFRRGHRQADIAEFLREFRAAPAVTAASVLPAEHVMITRRGRVSSRPRIFTVTAGLAAGAMAVAMLLRPEDDAPMRAAASVPDHVVPVAPANTTTANSSAAAATGAVTRIAPEPAAPDPGKGVDAPKPAAARVTKAAVGVTAEARVAGTRGGGGSSAPPHPAAANSSQMAGVHPTQHAATPPPQREAAGIATGAGADTAPSPAPQVGPPAPMRGGAEVSLSSLKFTRFVEPVDRPTIRNNYKSGWVLISFRIDAEGQTQDVEVLDASPKGHFDSAAVAAVRRWRFEPVVEDGVRVERRSAVRLRFQPPK